MTAHDICASSHRGDANVRRIHPYGSNRFITATSSLPAHILHKASSAVVHMICRVRSGSDKVYTGRSEARRLNLDRDPFDEVPEIAEQKSLEKKKSGEPIETQLTDRLVDDNDTYKCNGFSKAPTQPKLSITPGIICIVIGCFDYLLGLKRPTIMAHAVAGRDDVLPYSSSNVFPTMWLPSSEAAMHRLPCRGSFAYLRNDLICEVPSGSDGVEHSCMRTLTYSVSAKTALHIAQGAPRITQCHPAALLLGTAQRPRRYRFEPSACKLGFAILTWDDRSTSGHGVLWTCLGGGRMSLVICTGRCS